jgi:hypothetical protein
MYKVESAYKKAIAKNYSCRDCYLKDVEDKRIKWLNEHPASYNHEACNLFNEINERLGWNLQHAENGGEVVFGFKRVDAYDKARGIILEHDGIMHEFQKKDDRSRSDEITNQMIYEGSLHFYIIRYSLVDNLWYLHAAIINGERYTSWKTRKNKMTCKEVGQLNELMKDIATPTMEFAI